MQLRIKLVVAMGIELLIAPAVSRTLVQTDLRSEQFDAGDLRMCWARSAHLDIAKLDRASPIPLCFQISELVRQATC